jgi:hypothetical protein
VAIRLDRPNPFPMLNTVIDLERRHVTVFLLDRRR